MNELNRYLIVFCAAALIVTISGVIFLTGAVPTETVNVLADLGVKRISLAGGMARSVLGGFRDALAEIRDHGTTGSLECGIAHPEPNRLYGESD